MEVTSYISNYGDCLSKDGMKDINAAIFRAQEYHNSYEPTVTTQDYRLFSYYGPLSQVSVSGFTPTEDTPIIGSVGNDSVFVGTMQHCTGVFTVAAKSDMTSTTACAFMTSRSEPTVSDTIIATSYEWTTKYCCGVVCTPLGCSDIHTGYVDVNGVSYCKVGTECCWNCSLARDVNTYCGIYSFKLETFYLSCCCYDVTTDYSQACVTIHQRIYE